MTCSKAGLLRLLLSQNTLFLFLLFHPFPNWGKWFLKMLPVYGVALDFFFKVLHFYLELLNCLWADSLPPQRRETSSAEFTTVANSLGGSTKNTLHLEILDDSFPRADENYCYFFEGNFQEVLNVSIIRGVGFKCNTHHSFELWVNPVCFLQYPHISLWK